MFPEGGSHDQTDLLPFKAGIALMTFGTIVNTGQIPVIIPSGLKYFKRQEFRSKCVIEYGRPYSPSKKLVDLYKNGEKRKAVTGMLKDLQERMHEVIMTAPSYDELQAIYMARNLYLPKNIQNLSPEQHNEIYQRFAKGYEKIKDEPELRQLVDAITGYRQMLKLMNIKDDQVALFKQSYFVQIVLIFISLIRLLLSLIFVLPGNIMILPLSTAISFYAERERIKALKGSDVKVKANDVLSSIKILAYLSTFPIYLTLFTFMFYFMLRYYAVESKTYYTVIFFVIFPIIQIISIRSHFGAKTHLNEF